MSKEFANSILVLQITRLRIEKNSVVLCAFLSYLCIRDVTRTNGIINIKTRKQ